MSSQLNTPELAELLQQAKAGLSTQKGQVVIQQIHLHQNPTEPQGLMKATFRGTMRWVFRPIGEVAKWLFTPIWWPLGMLVRDVVATPKRVWKAFAEPWQQEVLALKEDHVAWAQASPEARRAMELQAKGWLGISFPFIVWIFAIEGNWKWIPILLFLGLTAARRGWCPVRCYLGLPQGGWPEMIGYWKESLPVVMRGGVIPHQAKSAAQALAAPVSDEPPDLG
ncbi:hypothetical protein [Geothrix sp. PMB-07]|uniref:hypothetical protein n=1 Tax=Geothrix sp. PMB-07 TaxID=3068640 RepID=UPI0027425FD4|nr:hypothetical protein [Geothrix sp. PMB-07]WLT30651.1 hypothetical protein Q9293_13095 [Geothrix sp. PMB-07]